MRTDRGARNDARQRAALQAMGPMLSPTTVKTAAYTAAYGELAVCNPTAAGFTLTLPRATDHADEVVAVKNASDSTNPITVDAQGSEQIDGGPGVVMTTARLSLVFVSDGTDWLIVWDYAGPTSAGLVRSAGDESDWLVPMGVV